MSRFKFIDRLILLEKLIRQRRTGTPDELAQRLSVSRSALYRKIDELNSYGAEIQFCRTRNSFYYGGDIVIDIFFRPKLLAETTGIEEMNVEEMKNISGGHKLFSKIFSPVPFFGTEML